MIGYRHREGSKGRIEMGRENKGYPGHSLPPLVLTGRAKQKTILFLLLWASIFFLASHTILSVYQTFLSELFLSIPHV